MSKGEFSNLSGLGKPLPQHQNTNPYVDFVTHKLNQVSQLCISELLILELVLVLSIYRQEYM